MTDYRKTINSLKFWGVPFRTFINDDGDKVIRYNEYSDTDYTDEIFNGVGKLIQIVDYENGEVHIQQ